MVATSSLAAGPTSTSTAVSGLIVRTIADVAHVDAAIERRGAGIEKRELEITVLRAGCCPTARGRSRSRLLPSSTIAVDGAVVDLHFEIAPRLVGADIVKHQHRVAGRDVVALRQRHEQFVMAAEIGETQTVDEADIGERDRGDEAGWLGGRGGRGNRLLLDRSRARPLRTMRGRRQRWQRNACTNR